MKIFISQLNPLIGDISGNTKKILQSIVHAKEKKASLIIFPELALSGYPPQDLLKYPQFLDEIEYHLKLIINASSEITIILGLPRREERNIYNSAAIIENGKLIGFQDKTLLPTYDVFNERRYFEPAKEKRLWNICNTKTAITICEDIWGGSELLKEIKYQCHPLEQLFKFKPELLINISASPFCQGKIEGRIELCRKVAKKMHCDLLLCNQVGANDGLIFDGHSLWIDSHGNIKAIGKSFEEDGILIDTSIQYKNISYSFNNISCIYKALVLGLKDYFIKSKLQKACLGLSGGIDSAVVAAIAVEALGAENVLAVAMPSRFSSKESIIDAKKLAENLGIELITIPIEEPFSSFLSLLHPFFHGKKEDITEENIQARIRGILLMALSNKHGHIVLSTGNKSELGMGYATLYGDMCGAISVIGDLLKREVYALAHIINRHKEIIPENILKKEPSAELRENQKDSDTLPSYEILDNIIQSYLEDNRSSNDIANLYKYPIKVVQDIIVKIEKNEYKRRQGPLCLHVAKKSFTLGRCFPIVQGWT